MASEKELFASLEAKYRLPQGYLDRLYEIESSRGADLASKTSSAKGPFQFTDRTAKAMDLKDPNDLAASADAAARLAVQNRAILQQNGVENPDGKILYLAHQQGAGGALKLLKGGNTPADEAVGNKAVINNGGEAGASSKGFVEQVFGKYEGVDPETLKPYSALKTSEPLDEKAADTLSVLEGSGDVAPEPRSTKRSALALNILSKEANKTPDAPEMMDIPDISAPDAPDAPYVPKPEMTFAKGGIADLPKSKPSVPPRDPPKNLRYLYREGMPKGHPKTGLMYPPSIIIQSLILQGASREDATTMFCRIGAMVKEGKARLVQLGNTVFVIKPKPDKSAEFYINSVEPGMVPARIGMLAKTLKHLGFRKMVTMVPVKEEKNADFVAKASKIQFKKVNTTLTQGKEQVPAVRYEASI
jgi:hypothetical protein